MEKTIKLSEEDKKLLETMFLDCEKHYMAWGDEKESVLEEMKNMLKKFGIFPKRNINKVYNKILDETLVELNIDGGWRSIFATKEFEIVKKRCRDLPDFDKDEFQSWLSGLSWNYR